MNDKDLDKIWLKTIVPETDCDPLISLMLASVWLDVFQLGHPPHG